MILFILLFSLNSFADEVTMRFGVEPVKKQNSFSDVKHLSIGLEADLKENVYYKFDLGYWADKRKGAENSFYFAPALGLTISPWIFKAKVYAGVAAISETDTYLGGHFQFYEGVYLGIFEGKASIGLDLFHLSSAGLYSPNIGRNFFTLTAVYSF